MLAGLLFLGVLAAASLPNVMFIARGGDDAADVPDTHPAFDDSATLAAAEGRVADGGKPDAGEDLFLDPPVGQTRIEDFSPGIDSLTIALPDGARKISAKDDDDGAEGALLSYAVAGGRISIWFAGLATVPVKDVFLRVSDTASPTLDADIALAQFLDGTSPPDDGAEVDPPAPPGPADPTRAALLSGEGGAVPGPVDSPLPAAAPHLMTPGRMPSPVQDAPAFEGTETQALLLTCDDDDPTGAVAALDRTDATDAEDDLVAPSPVEGIATLTLSRTTPLNIDALDGTGSMDLASGHGSVHAATCGFSGEGADTLITDVATDQPCLHGETGNIVTGEQSGGYPDADAHRVDAAVDDTAGETVFGEVGDDTIRGGPDADGPGCVDDECRNRRDTECVLRQDADADPLTGADKDGTLTIDRCGVDTDGEDTDVFWLYADGEAIVDIADFRPGEDVLRLTLNPQSAKPGQVAVRPDAKGLDGEVTVDGIRIAILRGAADASLADIHVETRADVFA